MRKFIKRADRLFDYVIGVDGWFNNKKFRPATLKDILDNFRNYTVLGFLWVGVKALLSDNAISSSYAAVALALLVVVLLLLVAAQTALLFLMSAFGWGGMLLPPRTAARIRMKLRSGDLSIRLGVFFLMVPVLLSAWIVASSLARALSRSGIL